MGKTQKYFHPVPEMPWKASPWDLDNYKDIHEGETAVIIGNGRSLEEFDLSRLDDYITFGTNFICDIYVPTYLTLMDHKAIMNWWGSIEPFIHKPAQAFVLDKYYFAHVHTAMKLDEKRLAYPDASTKKNPGTTANLKLAYWMGITTAYLIGVDFDPLWLHDRRMGEYRAIDKMRPAPSEKARERMIEQYWEARRNWEADGREIVNLTPGTWLGVFPEADWRQAL